MNTQIMNKSTEIEKKKIENEKKKNLRTYDSMPVLFN